MKIAVYTITRDRLPYTKHCLKTIKDKAGYPYDHYIYDNGSEDGTFKWLSDNKSMFAGVMKNGQNIGIAAASNALLDRYKLADKYDLIIKMDNDCEVVTPDILAKIAHWYQRDKPQYEQFIISPKVEGINTQVERRESHWHGSLLLGYVHLVGGLFLVVPDFVLKKYRYPTDGKLGQGDDVDICTWFRHQGGTIAYAENLQVNHYEGTDNQAKRFPEYFERKWAEND